MKNDHFGLMTYVQKKEYNVGDYVQSLAAEQYLPQVDEYINREGLSDYTGQDVKMIMNGWYMQNPEKFPPSDKITPLYVSFHLNSHIKDRFLTERAIEHMKKNGPIGCRDFHTKRVLEEKGIDCYYSGCLTTTLDKKYFSDKKTDEIYFADPFFNMTDLKEIFTDPKKVIKRAIKGDFNRAQNKKQLLKKLFSKSINEKAIFVSHKYPESHSEEKRFALAAEILHKYASAKLVITSRIHAALPCLALGTPVIFLNYGSFDATDLCRFEGIVDLFNTVNISTDGQIQANFEMPASGVFTEDFVIENPTRYLDMANKLKARCSEFIGN
jgi:hypothetical protein